MNLGRLSINQPILAMVLSIVLLIVGALAYTTLPVSEYPQVVPPTVVVTTQYPGASAQTVSDTVAAPIEQEINGVEDMIYMYSPVDRRTGRSISPSPSSWVPTWTRPRCWCRTGSPSRIPRLPEEVQQHRRDHAQELAGPAAGRVPDCRPTMAYDQLYISNYALPPGAGHSCCGSTGSAISRSSARAIIRCGCGWIPDKHRAMLGLTAEDVVAADARPERPGGWRHRSPSRRSPTAPSSPISSSPVA